MRGDGVDVHRTRDDGDRIVGSQRGREIDVLNVVDEIQIRQTVRVPLNIEIRAGLDVVAEINQRRGRVVQVCDDQVQVVHQLDAGGGISRRISPDQRHAQRLVLRRVGNLHIDGAAVTGGQRIGGTLVIEQHGARLTNRQVEDRLRVRKRRRQTVGQADQAPALIVDRVLNLQVIDGVDRTRAVDEQRLHQRRAVGDLLQLEKFLHQRQHAGHRRGRHARAEFVTIPVGIADGVVQIAQHLEIISRVVGRHDRHLQIKRDRTVGQIADGIIINRPVHQWRIRRQRHCIVGHEIVRRRHVV